MPLGPTRNRANPTAEASPQQLGDSARCLRPGNRWNSYKVATYDGPATVVWKQKNTVKSARVRCIAESYGQTSWQGRLVRFPRKLCRRWESEDILTLRLPDDETAAIRPTRISLRILKPATLGFVGVGSPPF